MSAAELLEQAARAAGIAIQRHRLDDPMHGDLLVKGGSRNQMQVIGPWNPLTDDGDALRLAVKLRISLEMAPEHVYAVHADTSAAQYRDTESGRQMDQVVREAIVACAAEIGRALQPNHESPANSKPGCTDADR